MSRARLAVGGSRRPIRPRGGQGGGGGQGQGGGGGGGGGARDRRRKLEALSHRCQAAPRACGAVFPRFNGSTAAATHFYEQMKKPGAGPAVRYV
ncbi:hypothetical protein LX36DRAFT_662406 [Colletotrichum falcatum]|nr:hypothetical protein LX36DRAFT_662406 [Colletotrichum falcatum]